MRTGRGTKFRPCSWSSGNGNKYASASVQTRNRKVVYIYLFAGAWKTETCVLDRGYVGEIGKGAAVTAFRFTSKLSAEKAGGGVDSIVIYNSKQAGWDGGTEGRPKNNPGCGRSNVGGRSEDKTYPPSDEYPRADGQPDPAPPEDTGPVPPEDGEPPPGEPVE